MELTMDDVQRILGAKELELIVLRTKVAQLEAKLSENRVDAAGSDEE